MNHSMTARRPKGETRKPNTSNTTPLKVEPPVINVKTPNPAMITAATVHIHSEMQKMKYRNATVMLNTIMNGIATILSKIFISKTPFILGSTYILPSA